MPKLDFSKITESVLAQSRIEIKIKGYKNFYKTYLITVKNRQEVLDKLYPLCVEFQKIEHRGAFYPSQKALSLELEAKELISKYFSPDVLKFYNKVTPLPKAKRTIDTDNSFWSELIISLSSTIESISAKDKQEWNYKQNFIVFLYSCLKHYGLHPDIFRRDPKIYKRYNFALEHYFKSKAKISEIKTLITPDVLQKDFLIPYEKKLPIKINGKLIPFESVYSINVSSILLLDDEIELYGIKNNFIWNNQSKDDTKFISFCENETDFFHKNPYLLEINDNLQNQNACFVHPTRLKELKSIKNKAFDLTKLIRLCEELNNASVTYNNFSASLLSRAIIDHIPPIFKFTSFTQLANNYSGGTKSFKKSMLILDNSLRNIADANIHSQIREKEVLPTTNQINFSQELDLLLSEIVRILK